VLTISDCKLRRMMNYRQTKWLSVLVCRGQELDHAHKS